MGGNTSLFDSNQDPQRNNQINKEEKEADDQFSRIEEYIDGKRTLNKRDDKAQAKNEKKVEKIQENLDQADFKK